MNFYPLRNVLRAEISMSKSMKRTILALLLIPLFPSCESEHDEASFRAVEAPAAYGGHKIDEEPQMTTTTTTTIETTRVYADAAGHPVSVSDPGQPSAPLTQTQHRVVTNEPSSPADEKPHPTATPRVARKENAPRTPPTKPAPPQSASAQGGDLPYGKPVPGKPGYVFSPFDKNGGYVDVTGYTPGQKVKDPYSGKIFLVP
jgi:hypothetical protein